jgi:hypothetical protein
MSQLVLSTVVNPSPVMSLSPTNLPKIYKDSQLEYYDIEITVMDLPQVVLVQLILLNRVEFVIGLLDIPILIL